MAWRRGRWGGRDWLRQLLRPGRARERLPTVSESGSALEEAKEGEFGKTHLWLPCRLVQHQIKDETDPPRPNDIVMVEEVASLTVLGARHVGLDPAERSTSRNFLHERAEGLAVDCVAEFEEGREEGELGSGKAGEVGEVAGLVDLEGGRG
jgi:hypothetical protein